MRHPTPRTPAAALVRSSSPRRGLCRWLVALAAVLGAAATPRPAAAQQLGTFTWAVQPYCNVVTLTITQVGSTYRLEGWDDQCGAGTRASAIGTAFANPDGTVGLGFNIVATPGGSPVHVEASISAPAFSGTWHDSSGATGPFTFSPVLPVAGAPRPTSGGLGVTAIDSAAVQRRVSGVCAPGSSMRVINQDGTVVCEVDSSSAGDITSVVAGLGLNGGAQSGTATLDVAFAGSGSASLVARSDHDHRIGLPATSTRIGQGALLSGVPGDGNTALGYQAGAAITAAGELNTALGARTLDVATTASENTALGASALGNTTTGNGNVAVGFGAAFTQTTGVANTAVGTGALRAKAGGDSNVAVGYDALRFLSPGSANIAIGRGAGSDVTSGSFNIFLGNDGDGVANQSGTIRIGSVLQSATYIRGIDGASVDGATDSPVYVDANHKLGTVTSSRRFKYDIQDLGPDGRRLQQLRPVAFRYLASEGRGDSRQFGLIAEEVEETMPELVVHDAEGQPFTVRYHQLPPLLLAEVQRLEGERVAQAARIDALERDLAALRTALREQ